MSCWSSHQLQLLFSASSNFCLNLRPLQHPILNVLWNIGRLRVCDDLLSSSRSLQRPATVPIAGSSVRCGQVRGRRACVGLSPPGFFVGKPVPLPAICLFPLGCDSNPGTISTAYSSDTQKCRGRRFGGVSAQIILKAGRRCLIGSVTAR